MAKHEASEIKSEKTTSRRMDRWIDSVAQNGKLWDFIAKNYEWISHTQISNGFILLMALNQAKNALTAGEMAGEISEIIVQKSKGHLYKFPSTLRDALEYRLKREGFVEDPNINNRSSIHKYTKLLSV